MTREQDIALYDAVAAKWWDADTRWLRTLHNLVPARLAHFTPMIGEWRGKDVLDLGCAGGFMAEALAARGARVSGIDPARRAVASAVRHARQSGHAIAYAVGVGERLPYADQRFDAVVCVDVLEHVVDLDAVLDEVARVLRPGGWFLFDTINRNPLSAFLVVTMAERVLGLLPRGTHEPGKFIRPDEMRDKLQARGFSLDKLTGLGPRGLNRRFDMTFGALPLTVALYMAGARLDRPV